MPSAVRRCTHSRVCVCQLDETMFDYYVSAVKDALEGKPDVWVSL